MSKTLYFRWLRPFRLIATHVVVAVTACLVLLEVRTRGLHVEVTNVWETEIHDIRIGETTLVSTMRSLDTVGSKIKVTSPTDLKVRYRANDGVFYECELNLYVDPATRGRATLGLRPDGTATCAAILWSTSDIIFGDVWPQPGSVEKCRPTQH